MTTKNHQPKRHILVAVSGNTPQIVTETLWYLRIKEKIPIESVYILTTTKGKEVARKKLGGDDGAIARFCREYGLLRGAVAFTDDHIIVLADRENNPLDDIRSTEDNRVLQRHLFSFIRSLTDDDDLVLHCSIGGGRRTMSAHMLLAMTIYGRKDDRLSHVLVQAEFESNGNFFFPPKKSEPIAVRDSVGQLQVMQTGQHGIELADIPIVRLRSLLGEESATFQTVEGLFAHLQYQVDRVPKPDSEPKLLVDLESGFILFDGTDIDLPPQPAAVFAYYAERKAKHCSAAKAGDCAPDCACQQIADDFDGNRLLEIYPRFLQGISRLNFPSEYDGSWLTAAGTGNVQTRKKRLRTILRAANKITAEHAVQLQITARGKRGYALQLHKCEITIIPSTKS